MVENHVIRHREWHAEDGEDRGQVGPGVPCAPKRIRVEVQSKEAMKKS